VPSAAGLALLGLSTIGAIYQGGRFQAYDIQQTAPALACYAIGRAGYAAIKAPAPAFHALGETAARRCTSAWPRWRPTASSPRR
jgi:peptidoglycan biosynthesis protein MviN/MurJ (putative lipid II flippase)